MNKKYTLLFAAIFCLGLLVAGGTYAYWTWTSDTNKNVVFNVSAGVEDYIVYDEGDSHFVGNFQPSDNYCDGISNTISFAKTKEAADVSLVATVYMNVNAIETNIKNSDYVKWAITAGDSSSCGTALHTGTFKNATNGIVITLETDIEIDTFVDSSGNAITKSNADTMLNPKSSSYSTNLNYFRNVANNNGNMFTIWIWIDSSGSNLSSLSGQTLDTNIWTQIDMLDVSEE